MPEWFYIHDGAQAGPVDANRIVQLLTSGVIRRDDLVWRKGMPNWAPAGTMPELQVQPVRAFPASLMRKASFIVAILAVIEIAFLMVVGAQPAAANRKTSFGSASGSPNVIYVSIEGALMTACLCLLAMGLWIAALLQTKRRRLAMIGVMTTCVVFVLFIALMFIRIIA